MARKTKGATGKPDGAGRKDRLGAALKANLQRRKAQARARGASVQDQSPAKGPEQRKAD